MIHVTDPSGKNKIKWNKINKGQEYRNIGKSATIIVTCEEMHVVVLFYFRVRVWPLPPWQHSASNALLSSYPSSEVAYRTPAWRRERRDESSWTTRTRAAAAAAAAVRAMLSVPLVKSLTPRWYLSLQLGGLVLHDTDSVCWVSEECRSLCRCTLHLVRNSSSPFIFNFFSYSIISAILMYGSTARSWSILPKN